MTALYHPKAMAILKNMAIYTLVFVLIYSGVNWWRQPVMPANPTLRFTTIDNQAIDLNALSQDKPVLMYFWGSWCGVCRQVSPSVNTLAQTSGYPVVTVAVSSGNNDYIKQYLHQHQWQLTTINDSDGAIFKAWQGQVTPSFVILEQGRMVQGLTGIHPAWELKLRMWLRHYF